MVMVSSHSKWLEAFQTKFMTAGTTIKLLLQKFATFGHPEILVSEKGKG